MIRVNRPKRIPKKLRDEGKSSDLVNRQTIDSNPTAEIKITNEIYGHKSIKTVLKKAHHKMCCYCEKDQKGENGAIEHFRPKAGYYILDRTEVLNKPAYYWLGYTWSNLLFVCSDCNGKKGNVFPLQNESTRAKTYQDEKEERRNFWNVRGQSVRDGYLQVVKNKAAFFNSRDNGSKVVIQQDHVSCLLGHI